MKSILFTISGTSPQIITETLFAINAEKQPWPEAIYAITTSVGKVAINEGLKEKKHLQRLCDEIKQPIPELTVWVIPDENGNEVEDAKSREDHEALANFIMEKAAYLTSDNETQIHSSIAGGRKTMTYYMGYAMSLFGRKQDRLSHVLVSDGYENLEDFYYPSQTQEMITHNYSKPLDVGKMPRDAKIMLADIPFIRMRNSLSAIMKQLGTKYNYRQLIDLFNIVPSIEDYYFIFDVKQQKIGIQDKNKNVVIEIVIDNLLAFAWYIAVIKTMLDPSLDKITRFKKLDGYDGYYAFLFLNELLICLGDEPIDDTGLISSEVIKIQAERLDDLTDKHPKRTAIMRSVNQMSNNAGIQSQWMNDRKNEITEILKNELPSELVLKLVPRIRGEDNLTTKNDEIPEERYYSIDIPVENIELI